MSDHHSYINAYTSAREAFGMWTTPPEQVFCHPSNPPANIAENYTYAVTWTGEPLSRSPVRFGRRWKDNFGGVRQSVSFVGLSGHWYHGTRYMGSGDYIRAKRGKLAS